MDYTLGINFSLYSILIEERKRYWSKNKDFFFFVFSSSDHFQHHARKNLIAPVSEHLSSCLLLTGRLFYVYMGKGTFLYVHLLCVIVFMLVYDVREKDCLSGSRHCTFKPITNTCFILLQIAIYQNCVWYECVKATVRQWILPLRRKCNN